MPLMEVVLEQTYAGQQCINRWNYVASGTPASVSFSFALIEALGAIWDASLVPPAYPAGRLMKLLAALQTPAVTFDLITARDVYSPTDFFSEPFVNALIGTQGGDQASPIDAYGFFSNRIRSDIRRGTKRFVGVSETLVGNLGVLTGGGVTLAQAVATEMSQVLTYDDSGNTLSFAPCVVKRLKYDTSIAPDGGQRVAYKYNPNEATQMDNLAVNVVWDNYPNVRSQTSRQYGKGR